MPAHSMTRRGFVKASGGALLGTLAFAGGPIALLAPGRSWSLSLSTLSGEEGALLLQMVRAVYPHEKLEDAVYALVVKDLDAAAGQSEESAKLMKDGLAELAKAVGGEWSELSSDRQQELLRDRQLTPFFQQVRSTSVVSLYNNELAFAHFGYEGPAFEQGGYLQRGFDDLDWLPQPDEAASPRSSA